MGWTVICGETKPEELLCARRHRLSAFAVASAILLCGAVLVVVGVMAAIENQWSLQTLAVPSLGALLVVVAAWRLVLSVVVIPRRTVVWFRYDRRTLTYRRSRDAEPRDCRPLDILCIESQTDRAGEVIHYGIVLVDGTRLIINRKALDNGDALAEQLAADIAHSPRWMFS